MKKNDKNFAKKVATSAIAIMCVCGVAVGGALAALQHTNDGVKNTFVASAGLIEPNTDPVDPNHPENKDGQFWLDEDEVKLNDAKDAYVSAEKDKRVQRNTYSNLMDKMTLSKDPKVTVNLRDEQSAYVFIAVKNTLAKEATGTAPITNMNISNSFEAIGQPVNGVQLYKYKDVVVANAKGNTTPELEVYVLEDNAHSVENVENLAENGTLEIKAYVCQSTGFATPEAAWNELFGNDALKF